MSYSYAATDLLFQILAAFWFLLVILFVLLIVADWKIFSKAGQPGWASIVPFYNSYIDYKIYWGNGWLFLVPTALGLLGAIPLLGALFALAGVVIRIITQYRKSLAFGQGIGFAIGLVLLNPIFSLILAFGNYQYFGIPMDGYSYDEMRNKYDVYRAAHPTQQTTYRQPDETTGHDPDLRYKQPDDSYHDNKE